MSASESPGPTPRRAGPQDAAALATLRGLMLDALAEDPEAPRAADDPDWHAATVDWLRERLRDTERFAAFVVDDAGGGPVSCAMGAVSDGAPVPGRAGRLRGQVNNVSTLPDAQHRGYARTCVVAVLEWLEAAGAARVDLTASPDGLELYRSLGFRARPWVNMRRES